LWQGDLLDLVQVHQINCDYILQSCINNGCNEKYLRKDVLHHYEVCLYKLIQCSYCENYVLRMNKENHEVECLMEEVNCIYHEIGCDKKFCRKDIQSHDQSHQANHMKLIYKNLMNCKQENIAIKHKLLTTNNKVTLLSQENITMKQECCSLRKEVVKLKKKSNNEVSQLKQEIKTMTTEFKEFEKNNINLKEKVNVASSEIVDEKQMPVKEVNNIDQLKATLKASPLSEKVSLLNNDKVLKVNSSGKIVNYLNFNQYLSECYKNNQFDYIINYYDLGDHRSLMKKLFKHLPYHLYELQTNLFRTYIILVFPLDLNNIKNFEVMIPNYFKVKVVKYEISVELTYAPGTSIHLYMGKYYKQLQHQQKFNIQQINGCANCLVVNNKQWQATTTLIFHLQVVMM